MVELREESEHSERLPPPLPESFSQDLKKLTSANSAGDRDDYNSSQSGLQKKNEASRVSEHDSDTENNFVKPYASLNPQDSH